MTGTIRQQLSSIGQSVVASPLLILMLTVAISTVANTAEPSSGTGTDGAQGTAAAATSPESPDESLKAELEALMRAAHDAQAAESDQKASQPSMSAYQQQQAFYAAREQARLEKIQKERQLADERAQAAQVAPPRQREDVVSSTGAVASAATPLPQLMANAPQQTPPSRPPPPPVRSPGPLARINIAFHTDNATGSAARVSDNWFPQISGAHDGEFTVLARAEGRDTDGRVVNINPDWVATDPSSVTVSPGTGQAVRITVRRAGASNLTVTAAGLSKDLAISAAPDQLHALRVDILQ